MINRNLLFLILFFALTNSYASFEEIFNGKTSIEKPLDLRDPFASPMEKLKMSVEKNEFKKDGKDIYSNIKEIGQVKVEELQIIGVLIGKNRRAIVKVKGANKGTFILKEGMKLGENKAEIKAILPGGVILVEKLTNIYGEEEYLETVIPISR